MNKGVDVNEQQQMQRKRSNVIALVSGGAMLLTGGMKTQETRLDWQEGQRRHAWELKPGHRGENVRVPPTGGRTTCRHLGVQSTSAGSRWPSSG
jgi:hypothetical protein